MNFEKYVGIPYAEKGRDITGLDCYGLVRLIYKNEYKIDLPSFTAEYNADDNNRIQDLIAQYKEGWEPVDTASVGDVVIFRIMGVESHIGVVISPTHFIHVRENQDSAVESLNAYKWSKRIVGFFKYSEKNNAILNTVPHPLKTERYTVAVVPGTNITDLVKHISLQYNVAPELKSRISIIVNGRVIAQENWSSTIINKGDVIEYRAVPGKDALRLVAVLALAYFAPIIAGELIASTVGITGAAALGATGIAVLNGIATVGVMLAGTALINAIAPIRPNVRDGRDNPFGAGLSAERQLMVGGGSNQLNAYGSIPVVLGKVRMTPNLGSFNYLTYENQRDSYLSMLLVWGYGPLLIDDTSYKIGDLPLSSFTDVTKITLDRIAEPTAEVKRNFDAIYGKDITQVNTQVELVCDGNPQATVAPGPWFEAATTEEVNSVTIAIHFPQGLRVTAVQGYNAGNSSSYLVNFRAEYSVDSGSTWQLLEQISIGDYTASFIKDGFTYTRSYSGFNSPNMIVRVRRETGDNVEDDPTYRFYFTSILQNVTFLRNSTPALDPVGSRIAKTAFKIKATNQLNGTIQGVSAVVQTWCKVWNGTAWVDGATSNPAALMRYVLEHPANPRRITNTTDQINLNQLQHFYEYCQDKGFEYNGVLGEAKSILEVLRDICSAGRASPALVDGKWTVVIDEPKTTVVQHFTPHNSWGFEATKALPKRPDGLRITYYDQDQDYQESEIIVYDIGKNANNSILFESITLPGVTKKSLVIDHARWHMAQIKLRTEIYTITSDIEYLVCNRGDRVKVMHDVPMWGLGSGRIKNRISNTKLQLDEEIPMQANVNYVIRFRSKTGASVTRNIVPKTVDGYYNEIDLQTSVTVDEADVTDLFLFGETNQEAQDLILLSIEPAGSKSARLVLTDYGVTPNYNIFTDYLNLTENTVFEAQLSLPPVLQLENFGNLTPIITGFVSDESVMERVSKAVFRYNLNVSYVNAANLPVNTEMIEVQYDFISNINVSSKSVFVPYQNGSASIGDVKQGETYKVRMRYISRNGKVGTWTSYSNHTIVGKTSPPSTVTEFTASADKSSGQLLLSWHNNPEYDVSTYEIRSEDTGWGTDDYRRVFYGDATKTFVQYESGNFTFYIRAVDSSGNYSLTSNVVTFTPAVVSDTTDIRYAYNDTALTNATVTLDWEDVTNSEFNVAYYEVSYNGVVKTVKANTITLPADWIGNRLFTIKTVDVHGNESNGYSESVAKLIPNPPFDLRTQVIDNTVMLYWTLPERTSLPIDHVLIKKGPVWETAALIGDKKGAFTTINESQGAEYTYWLVCVDTEGAQSSPVSITTLVSEPPDFVFHGEFNSSFEGTKSSAIASDGVLTLPINTVETFEEHFTTRSWTTPEDQVNAGYPIFIQPSGNTSYYEETFDFGQPLASSRVSLTYKGVIVAGSPIVNTKISLSLDNSTYVDYNGVTDVYGLNFRYVKIRITVSASTNIDLYEISNLSVRLDAKLKSDAGNISALSTDTLGTIVNFTKDFIDVQSINISPAGTTPTIPVYDFKDELASATYVVSSNVCTVTSNNHGLISGQKVKVFFGTGSGISAVYTVTSYTVNTFTFSMITSDSSGSCSTYPQSFRIYLFDNSGTRISSTTSWSIKGY